MVATRVGEDDPGRARQVRRLHALTPDLECGWRQLTHEGERVPTSAHVRRPCCRVVRQQLRDSAYIGGARNLGSVSAIPDRAPCIEHPRGVTRLRRRRVQRREMQR